MTVQHPLKLQEAAFLDESKVCLMRADSQETDLHEHEFLELTYVTRGSAQHQLGAAVMELHAGDYFLVDLGSLHSYRNGQGLEVINCLFSPAYVDRALVHCPSLATLLSTDMRQFGAPVVSPADRVFHDSNGDILRLMEAMEREYAQRDVGYLEMIRCHLIQVLVRTIRSAAVGGLAARRHPAIAAAVDALRASYAQPFSLARLSQQLGYTPQYLSRLFHQEMGQSLSTYLQRLRVEASCQRLLASRDTVSSIAQAVGYTDLKHFTAVFRRHMGMTPRAFRSRMTAGTAKTWEGQKKPRIRPRARGDEPPGPRASTALRFIWLCA